MSSLDWMDKLSPPPDHFGDGSYRIRGPNGEAIGVNELAQAAYWGDIKFQCMRLEMIHSWTTTTGTEQNIAHLLRYIGGAKDDYWRLVRIYRCRMLLNAAYASLVGRNDLACKRITRTTAALDRERDKVLSRRKWNQVHAYRKWNWEKTKLAAEKLYEENPGLFDTLRRNVEGKTYNNPNYDPSRARTAIALSKLIRILRDVEFDHAP
jgi:hypothetical protein